MKTFLRSTIFIFLGLVALSFAAVGQTYDMATNNGQTITSCKAIIMSSAYGYSSGYNNSENTKVTFYSGSASTKIKINFLPNSNDNSYFDAETNYDYLYIYDNATGTGSPIATLTGTYSYSGNASGLSFTSTTGYLTLKFSSDGSTRWYGFIANIGCEPSGCNGNLAPQDNCGGAPQICDLNGYCGQTGGWYTPDRRDIAYDFSGPFCGSIENNSWISFTAAATTATFNITSSNCISSSSGLQALVLQMASCAGSVTSKSNCINQSSAPGSATLTATGLTVGQVYYIMIDGYAGNICDYTVTAQSGVQTVNIASSQGATVCSGGSTTLSVSTVGAGPFTYNWTAGGPSLGTASSLTVSPTSTTNYTVTVTGACGANKTATYTVNVNTPTVSVSPASASICSSGSVALTTTASTSPAPVTKNFASGALNVAIPDNNSTGVSNNINVSGYAPTNLSSGTLVSVRVNITHTYDGDLQVILQSPAGTQINLSNRNGGSGDNYTNTVFMMGASTAIASGSAPFTGNYIPDGNFSSFNGQVLNGNWTLIVKDLSGSDVGTLNNWDITFNLENNIRSYAWSPASGLSASNVANPTASPSSTTTYTVTVTDLMGCTKSATTAITVAAALSGGTVATDQTICSGTAPAALTSSTAGSGGTGASSYQWQKSTDGGTTWTNIAGETAATYTPPTLSATTLYRRVYTNTCGSVNSNTVTISMYSTLSAGVIGSSQSICYNTSPANLSFTTNASGGKTSYSYQWQESSDNATWTNISGATSATYGPGNLTATKYYRVRVTDACGTVAYTSSITITVYNQVSGGTIASNQTICSGSTPATLSSTVAASGGTGATTYQWQQSTDGGTTWTNIGGATGATYSPGSVSATTIYRRVATNTCGSANSNNITITTNPLPSVTNVSKTDVTICGGNNGSITITASGTPTLNYSINGGTTYQNSNLFTNLSQGTSTIIVKDGNGCTYSWGQISISNGSAPAAPVASSSTNVSVCNGTAMSPFSVTNAGYQYTWWSNPGLTTEVSPANHTTSFTPSSPAAGSSATYYVTATSAGCTSAGTPFTINVYSNVSAGSIGSNQTICSGATPALISELTPASGGNSGVGYTYQWEQSTDGGSSWTNVAGATSANYTPPSLTTTTIYRRKVINTCGTVVSNQITITVNPNPTVNAVTDVDACPGASIPTITFGSNVGGSTFSWTAGGNFASVGLGSGSGSGNIPSWTAPTNNTGVNITTSVSVIASNAGCPGAATNFNIIIKPTPTVNSLTDVTVCPTQSINIGSFSSTPAGGSFAWTNNNTAIGIAASGTGTIGAWNAPANATGDSIKGTISYTTTLNGCVSSPKTVKVAIKPTPTLGNIANQTYCPGATINAINFNSSPAGATVNWTNSNTSIDLAANGSGNIPSWTAPSNVTGVDVVGNIQATPTLNGCAGNNLNFSISIKPTPILDPINDVYACPGSTVNVPTFSSTPTGTFNWTNNNTAIGVGASGTGNINPYTAPSNSTGANIAGDINLTVTSNGCTGSPAKFSIIIYPTPVINPIADLMVCPGQTVNIATFSSTPPGATFSWANTNTAIGLAASGAGSIAPFTVAQNNGSLNITGNITVLATGNGCASQPINFNISIKPKPQLSQLSDISSCANSLISVPSFTSTPSGASFQWLNNDTLIGLAAVGSGNIGTFTSGVNNTGNNLTGVVSYVGVLNGCVSDTSTFNISIKPTPLITPKADLSACAGNSLGPINFTANPGGATFNWTNSNAAIGILTNGVGDIPAWSAPNNTSGSSYVGQVIITPTLSNCSGANDTIQVTVLSSDNASVTYPSLTVCSTGSNPTPSNIASPGGTFSISGGAIINNATGEVDLSSTSAGNSYTITYTTNGTCPATRNYTLTVQPSNLNANFVLPNNICQNSGVVMPTFIGGGSGGSFSLQQVISGGPTLAVDPSTGAIDPLTSNTGTYIVLNSIAASGGCSSASDTAFIIIKSVPNASFTGLQTTYCVNSSSVTLSPQVNGGTFSGSGVTGNTFNPSTAGIGNQSVTYTINVNGCSAASTQNTTVNGLPTVKANTNKDSVCIGQSVVLTGAGAQSYSWNHGVSDGISFNPNSTLTYTVTGTDFNNCSNTDTIRIKVNQLPNVSVNNVSICQGQAATLTATNAATYTWNTGATTNQITISPSATVNYWVTGVSASGCAKTDTAKVTVNANPVTSITASPSQVCQGQSSTLTASGTASSFSWTHNGSTLNQISVSPNITATYTVIGYLGACSDTVNRTVTVINKPTVLINGHTVLDTTICNGAGVLLNASGATTYTWSNGSQVSGLNLTPSSSISLTVIGNTGGCIDSAKTNITVGLPINLTVTDTTICQGQSGTLVASGAQTYTWSSGVNGNSLTLTLHTTGSFSYNVTGIDANGCIANGHGTFTVNPLPTVSLRDTSICENIPVTLNAGGAVQYSWNTGDQTPNITVSPASTSSYTVIGTNNYGCSKTAMATVTIKSTPVATINGQSPYITSICEQTLVSLTGGGGFTYSWSNGSQNTTIHPTVSTSSIYTLTATAISGCWDTALAIISTNTPPVIQVNSPNMCPGNSATLTATGGVNYQWSDGTLNSTLVVAPVVSTTYTVEGTDVNGCKGTAYAQVTLLQNPTITAIGATICKGSTAVVTVSGNASSYTWNTGYIGTSLSVQPLNSEVYTVVASDGACSSTATAIVDVKSVATIKSTGEGLNAKCDLPNGAVINASVENGQFIHWLDANGNTVSNDLNPINLAAGVYTLVAISLDGCVTTATSTTLIGATPKANASFTMSDSSGIVPLQIQFNNTSTAPMGINIVKYSWLFGDESHTSTSEKDPLFTYYYGDKTDTVKLLVIDNNGCVDTALAYIKLIEPSDSVFVPNIFSPNDDSKNDVFFVKSSLIQQLRVVIYNRWGQLIYEWEGTNTGWDGRSVSGALAPEGTYFYLISGHLKDGSDIPDRFKKGYVTLVR